MPLIAEVFWKEPNAYDVAGVLGLVIGIVSIWLAKRDIEKRVAEAGARAGEAARDEVRRVAQVVLQVELSDAIRFLELARVAATGHQWLQAVDLVRWAGDWLARVLEQPLGDANSADVRGVAGALQGYLTALQLRLRAGRGGLAPEVQSELDAAIRSLKAVHARLTRIRPE